MNAVRFNVVVGSERMIPLPEGILLAPGMAEVIVLQPLLDNSKPPSPNQSESTPSPKDAEGSPAWPLVHKLANLAKELGIDTSDLPTDLAENHDHYLHGLPKGIDKT